MMSKSTFNPAFRASPADMGMPTRPTPPPAKMSGLEFWEVATRAKPFVPASPPSSHSSDQPAELIDIRASEHVFFQVLPKIPAAGATRDGWMPWGELIKRCPDRWTLTAGIHQNGPTDRPHLSATYNAGYATITFHVYGFIKSRFYFTEVTRSMADGSYATVALFNQEE